MQTDIHKEKAETIRPFDTTCKVIHVFVALCDNTYQGIVPVPDKIGNGQDPKNNLYWGCAFGIKTFFKNSAEWTLIQTTADNDTLLERLVFKYKTKPYYLVADAYNGRHIKPCTIDFLRSSSGQYKDTLRLNDKTIGIAGNAVLTAYIGHDGLMDFALDPVYQNEDGQKRRTIILACFSKKYFSALLKEANIDPLLWSTHLMSPEAYTLHDALTGFIQGATHEQINHKAAAAYSKYQKCSLPAAKKLIVSGW
ncbi:hypothetical protein DBR32_00905 [Taibaiella sp. KBW10]|nr:hypothetical protein DBR32_00905 [Taibaiella sp. KBW10]